MQTLLSVLMKMEVVSRSAPTLLEVSPAVVGMDTLPQGTDVLVG